MLSTFRVAFDRDFLLLKVLMTARGRRHAYFKWLGGRFRCNKVTRGPLRSRRGIDGATVGIHQAVQDQACSFVIGIAE